MTKVPQNNFKQREIPIRNPRTKIVMDMLKETKLPHPFKCSKCIYVAKNRADLKLHWLDEH